MLGHEAGLGRANGGGEFFDRGRAYSTDRAKAFNQNLAGGRTDAWDGIEQAGGGALAAEEALIRDGKAVGFIANALEELENMTGCGEQDGFEVLVGDNPSFVFVVAGIDGARF